MQGYTMKPAKVLLIIGITCTITFSLFIGLVRHFGIPSDPAPPPGISADGRFVVFPSDSAITLYNRDTRKASAISPLGPGCQYELPRINDDGSCIAFIGASSARLLGGSIPNGDTYLYDLNAKKVTKLASGDGHWGDGWLQPTDGQDAKMQTIRRKLARLPSLQHGMIGNLGISADGRYAAFQLDTPRRRSSLCLHDLKTGRTIQIPITR